MKIFKKNKFKITYIYYAYMYSIYWTERKKRERKYQAPEKRGGSDISYS